ncbi:hypothetical protein EZV73_02055 [Acidaminobacter sp. JC074]|uniref:hypothetical protein n=1 Tax=Acidaminobacter sp. JC074 TaxID=2530199 RepID=UPI001F0FC234|nr:hypothetical protein [Acidaminobacter sp. JC074]MCH4886329.1 hypothetical protein [Acidaminobacter sp. JC074]
MNKEKYFKEVVRYIHADKKSKRRIYEDLISSMEDDSDEITYEEIVMRKGSPKEMANDFMDNLDMSNDYHGVTVGLTRSARSFEYVSEQKFNGMPLIHIKTGGRYGTAVAKGIIAIGDVSIGLISIGGVSFGLVSLGGVSIGLVALGGIAGGLIAFGGIAIGLIAFGGISIGVYKALGGLIKIIPFL